MTVETDWSVVWQRRLIFLKAWTTTKLASTKFGCQSSLKTFFKNFKVNGVTHLNSLFEALHNDMGFEWVWISKNHHWLTFLTVETDWSAVWQRSLIFLKAWILTKFPSTKFWYQRPLKTFFKNFKVNGVTHLNSLFEALHTDMGFEWVWISKNHHWLTFPTVETDWIVVWQCRLIFLKAWITTKLASTKFGCPEFSKNFFQEL